MKNVPYRWNIFGHRAFSAFDQAYGFVMTSNNSSKEGQSANADPAIDAVSRRLRDYYNSVKDEAIPDRFLDLLQKLDEADRTQSPGTKSSEHRT